MQQLNKELGYKTLTECVMDYLKKQLNSGAIKPEEEVDINELSKILAVSRTPIREALLQLSKEGYIEHVRKAFTIKRITQEEIKDIYQVVGILEAEASKTAANDITAEDITLLEDLYNGMKKSLAIDDFKTYLELNFKTHSIIVGYCNNPVLINTVRQLKERLYEFPTILINIPEWEIEMMDDHSQMIELLKNKNKEGLANLIRNVHWSYSRNYQYLSKYYDIK